MSSTATSPTSTASSHGSDRQQNGEPEAKRQRIQQKSQAQKKRDRERATDKTRADNLLRNKRKEQHRGDYEVQPQRQPCGAYNLTGCMNSAQYCKYDHIYDQQAGSYFYQSMSGSAKTQKGLRKGSNYPSEFDDLRNRNPNSLSQAEKEQVMGMSNLDAWHADQPMAGWSRNRKIGVSVQQASITMEAEDERPRLTQHEREEQLRDEMRQAVNAGIIQATHRMLQEVPSRHQMKDEEHKAIVEEAEADLAKKLAALTAEFAMIAGTCYMQQEMLEIKESQVDSVQNHRFKLIPLGALGVYKPNQFNCNEANKGHLLALMKNLSRTLLLQNEEREDAVQGYLCRFCRRTLYLSTHRAAHIMCACLRCVSTLYCGRICRDSDKLEHQMSCFLHPGWECEESTKRRMEKMRIAGEVARIPEDVRIPEIPVEMRAAVAAGGPEEDNSIVSIEDDRVA